MSPVLFLQGRFINLYRLESDPIPVIPFLQKRTIGTATTFVGAIIQCGLNPSAKVLRVSAREVFLRRKRHLFVGGDVGTKTGKS